jgi:hypothetical protein
VPWPVFAPVETTPGPTTRVVQETTAIPWPVFAVEVPSSSAQAARSGSSPERGLGQAVDLTRQALGAWLDVLEGSAPVEVTAR